MSDTLPRGPGRPRKDNALTAAQRSAAMRERRGLGTLQLESDTLAQLDAIRERDGDASRVAVVARLAREAAP